MSLKEMCVHCLDLQQIPRPEKKNVQTKCYSNSSSFLTPGKGNNCFLFRGALKILG